MVRVTGFTQMPDHVIRMYVDDPTGKENNRSDNELRTRYPRAGVQLRIVLGRQMEEPVTLDVPVDEVPDHRQHHNDYRHLAVALQQQGEDERTLEIVELKEQEEQPVRCTLCYTAVEREGLEIEVQHHEEHRTLHQQPAYFVVQRRSPFLRTHFSITCVHKIQGDKYDKAHQKHDVQQVVKEINRVDIFYRHSCLLFSHSQKSMQRYK